MFFACVRKKVLTTDDVIRYHKEMRTIVDIPEDQVKALDLLGKKDEVSRAELVRRAVDMYLESQKTAAAGATEKYFGFLDDSSEAFEGMDSLGYEQNIRSEWDQRDEKNRYWGLHEKEQAPFAHKIDKDTIL